ncbi:MAG: hypothetical protein KME43_14785 [Myxacorys chilensis ATA2-1-KO14]|nr:hypothetical protein [Myxacorys chilensis ATA2-1-KO14]
MRLNTASGLGRVVRVALFVGLWVGYAKFGSDAAGSQSAKSAKNRDVLVKGIGGCS